MKVKRGMLRKFVESNPEASIDEIQRMTGCSRSSAFTARARARKAQNGLIKTQQEQVLGQAAGVASIGFAQAPIGMQIDVGAGLRLKMTEKKRTLGTVEINPTGLSFIKANGKKKPTKSIPWGLIEGLLKAAESL